MNEAELFAMAGVSTGGIAIVLLVYRILKYVNGKRIRSQCCGQDMTIGVVVEPITPTLSSNPLAQVRILPDEPKNRAAVSQNDHETKHSDHQ